MSIRKKTKSAIRKAHGVHKPFGVGTKVNHAGYKFKVTGMEGTRHRTIKGMDGQGETIAEVKHLSYWRTKKR